MEISKPVSRREFLKVAGLAGATTGAGTGLGGLVAACGEEETTTTTAAATSTTAAPQTTATTAASTTTVSAGPEVGREVKVGFVDPLTGVLAAFGLAGDYCVGKWRAAVGDGVVLGDGMMHPFNIQVEDGGTFYPISRYSGGEMDMIAVSVRVAISEYLMRFGPDGASYSFLILDEVFGSQDQEHREKMIQMLRSLEERFPQIIAISHISDVQGQFDNTLQVVEDELGNSRVEAL